MSGSGAPSADDRAVKRARLLAILEERDALSLVLSSHGALAWYLDGARTHTSLMGDPVLQVRVDRDGDVVSAFSNEAARLLAEELPSGIEVSTVPWFGALGEGFAGTGSGAGPRSLVESDIAAELRAARASLLPAELARYRALCIDAAEVMTDALSSASPGQSERALAASVGAGLLARGADPLVLMVSGSARAGFRHPLPGDQPIGARAMVVACARRYGMIANITRWVSFAGESSTAGNELLADSGRRILEVEAAYFDATVPGATLASAFEAGAAAYASAGFAADEWRNHHQGGAAGYNGRDPRATPQVFDLIQPNQVFAWNPSAPGAKLEDTVLLGPAGIEPLTLDPRWPTDSHKGRARPAELRL
jgi:Xaa-Pro aminopeptidase